MLGFELKCRFAVYPELYSKWCQTRFVCAKMSALMADECGHVGGMNLAAKHRSVSPQAICGQTLYFSSGLWMMQLYGKKISAAQGEVLFGARRARLRVHFFWFHKCNSRIWLFFVRTERCAISTKRCAYL